MVSPAQQDQVVLAGEPATVERDEVVEVAPDPRHLAARELAVPVADLHGAAQADGNDRGGFADVEHEAGSVGEHPAQRRVTDQLVENLGRQCATVRELSSEPFDVDVGAAGEGLDIDDDIDGDRVGSSTGRLRRLRRKS